MRVRIRRNSIMDRHRVPKRHGLRIRRSRAPWCVRDVLIYVRCFNNNNDSNTLFRHPHALSATHTAVAAEPSLNTLPSIVVRCNWKCPRKGTPTIKRHFSRPSHSLTETQRSHGSVSVDVGGRYNSIISFIIIYLCMCVCVCVVVYLR